MPSKKSTLLKKGPYLLKHVHNCSEEELEFIAHELAKNLKAGHRVLLEGELGAGKSTLARMILIELGCEQKPEGSPTFALAHSYVSPRGPVFHLDFYRIRSEVELEEMGASSYFWEVPGSIVLVEWASLWPSFESAILGDRRDPLACWRVYLKIQGPDSREVRVERIF